MTHRTHQTCMFSRPLVALLMVLCTSGIARSQDLLAANSANNSVQPAEDNTSSTITYSQRTMPLETFMRQFQRDYGIYFSYQTDSLKETIVVYAEPVNRKEDPGRLLSSVLTPVGLTYKIVNNV
ncbi:MAG TPA: hypothetical protein VIM64_05585, partial [Puia sp.]